MPNYLVELEDGRKLQVEADSQPTEQEVLAALGDSAPAEKQRPFIDITDTASALGEFARGIPTTTKSSYYQIKEGLDNPWKRSENYLAAGKATQEYQKELDAAEAAAVESGDTSSVSSAFRAAAPSSGFSIGTMASSLAGGSLLGTVGGRVGAAMGGPAGLAAGEIGGRVVGAFGSAYGAAYRAAGAQFLDDARDEINYIAETKFGRPLTEAEQEEAYQELLPLAQAFGNAEAGPEAIGNLAMGAAGRFVLGLGRETVKRLATSALAKAGAVAGGATVELGGETATQVEQKRIEEQKQALLEGRDPAAVAAAQPDRTVAEYATALEEVGPATLATLFLMGGAGKVASKVLDMSRPAPVSLTEEELRASVDLGYAKAKLDEEKANAAEDTGYQSSRAILKAQRVREGYEKVRQTLAEGDIEEAAKLMQAKIVEQSVLATTEEEAPPTETANVEIDGAGTWNSDSGVPLEVAKGIIESKDTKGIQSLIDNGVLTPPQVIPKTAPPDAQAFAANAAKAAATGVPVNATVAALRDTSGVEDLGTTEGDVLSLVPKKPVVEEPVAPNEAEIEALVPELFDPALSTGSRSVTPEITEKKDAVARKLESLLGLPSGHLTPMRWNVSKVFKTADGRYLKVGAAADAESLQRLQDQLELAKESPHAVVPELRVLHSAGIYALTQSDAGIEGADLHKSATKEDKQLFELLKEQNPFSAETSNGALRVETDTSLKNMALYVGPDGMVRTRAFDFDGVPEDTSPADVAAAKEVLAKTPLMPGIPLAEFSPAIQNRLAPAEQPVAEEVADPFTPVVETTGKKDLQVEPDTRTEAGMPSTPPQRDTTKPEQMTPGEYASSERDPELPKNYVLSDGNGNFVTEEKNGWFKVWRLTGTHATLAGTVGFKGAEGLAKAKARLKEVSAEMHEEKLQNGIRTKKPVSKAAVDAYGITLPEGYVKQGDLYVFQPQTKQAAETQTSGVAVERDLTNLEQMTPDEVNSIWNDAKDWANTPDSEIVAKYQKQFNASDAYIQAHPFAPEYWRETQRKIISGASPLKQHTKVLNSAIAGKKPVSAAAVDAYGITLPQGYVKQGELYVFSPQTKESETETAATEGTVMPGGSAIERDTSKPEQMTPEERRDAKIQVIAVETEKGLKPIYYLAIREGDSIGIYGSNYSETDGELIGSAKPVNLIARPTLEEVRQVGSSAPAYIEKLAIDEGAPIYRANGIGVQAAHQAEIASARLKKAPVSKAAVDTYGITLPEGYVQDGELYVYRPSGTVEAKSAPPAKPAPQAEQPAPQRDTSKPEQMTPEESYEAYTTAKNLAPNLADMPKTRKQIQESIAIAENSGIKDPELQKMFMDSAKSETGQFAGPYIKAQRIRLIEEAMEGKKPVSKAAVDAYGITLPEGYAAEGELYVFQPSGKVEEVTETEPPAKPAPQPKPAVEVGTPISDPLGYGTALIALFPSLQKAGVTVIPIEEAMTRLDAEWQKKKDSGKATRLDQIVYEANKRNTQSALDGENIGGIWTRTDKTVAVSNKATPSAMAHEVGHAIMELEYANAPEATKKAIEAEYTEWFKSKYGPEGVPTVADQRRIWEWMTDADWLNPATPFPQEQRVAKWEAYRSGFNEWFADEVAKWAVTRQQPRTLVDKFFSEIAAKLQKLWDSVKSNFSPNETLASWLDSISVVSEAKKAKPAVEVETPVAGVKAPRKPKSPKPVTEQNRAPVQEEEVAVDEAPRPLPPKYKPNVGDLVSGTVNGVPVVGKVTRVSGGGTVTAEYGNGKEFITNNPVPAAQSLAAAPKYQYTQEQNTAKAARLGLPTTPGVTENAGEVIRNVLVNVSKDTRLSPLTRAIARALLSVNFDGVRLRIKADGRSGAGLYTHEKGTGEIMVNLRAVARGQVDSIGVFLHEALHHATLEKLFNPAPGIETEAVDAIKKIVDHVKTLAGPDTVFDYELGSPWEFVSALFTRPDFQNYLASVPAPGSPTGIAKFRSALSELFRRLAELVTGQKVQKGSTMEQAIAATMVLFETPQRTGDGAAEAMAEKMTPDKARAILTKRFGKAGGKFVVGAFNADGDIEWDAKIGDGNITLNLKYLDTEAKLIDKAEHELAHAVFDDPAVQEEWKAISRTLSPAAREKLAARLKGLGYSDMVLDEEMLVQTLEEIRRNTPPAAWQRFVKAVRDALLRLFGIDVSQGDAERAAARIVAAGEAALAQGLDPAVAAFGQSAAESAASRRHAELEAKFNAGTITPEETAEAQALVDQAAKAANYDTSLPLVHHTFRDFTVFKMGGYKQPYSDAGWSGKGVWMEPEKLYLAKKAKGKGPNIAHTHEYESKLAKEKYAETGRRMKTLRLYAKMLNPVGIYGASGTDFAQEQRDEHGFSRSFPFIITDKDLEILRAKRKDAAFTADENGNIEEVIVFDPNQIKSAAPFTGIPLDRRFDAGSNDIRYSRVPDAELNEQTNVQFGSEKQRNIRPAAPQQETANKASAIIGEAIAKDPVNGRMNALLRFDSDTKIPLEVRAIGAAMLAEQVEYLNVLSARAGNAPPEATDLADDFVDRAISIVQRLGTELGRGLNIFNALARLTPEGFIRRRMRQHAKGVDEVIRQNFTGDLRSEIERLWQMMQEAGNTPRGEAFAAALKAFMPRRVDRKKNIESLFKSAGFRERMAEAGGESLVRDFFQMMAGPRAQAGPLAEFDASIQSALSGMLRKVMESKGLVAENQSVQATDIDKLVRSVSADALRFEKIAAADAAMQEELDKIEDPERRAVLQQAWEEATSKMYTNIASEATLRRAVNAQLKETPVEWTALYDKNRGTDAEKSRVVAAVMSKVEALLTNADDKGVQQNLDMLRSEVGEAFDQVAAIKRAQWLAGREAAESRRRTAERKAAFVEALKVKGISEKALLDLNAKLDLPARPGAERNEVSVLIGDNIKAPVEDFVAKLTALGVDQDTAEALDKVSAKLRAEYAEAARVAALEALKLVPTKLTRQAIERLNSIMAGPMKPHVKGEVATLISDHSKAIVPDFVERMVALGVDRAAAVDLDNILKTSRVDRFLASLLKVAPERNKTAKEKLSKVIRTVLEAGNLGAMDSQQFMDLFAKEFGLPPMTKEFKAEIKEMVRGINALPKGPARIDAIQALEEKLALWEGIKTRDVLMSTWYANILSGVSTQAIGLLYNNLNLLLKSVVTMLANPKSAKAFVQGALGEGLRTGLKEAVAALQGRGLYKASKWGDKKMIDSLGLLSKQGPRGAAQWAAYLASVGTLTRKVFHVMEAVDALAWNTAREGHAYLAAHRALREELASSNPTAEEFSRKFVEKLGGDTAQIEADLREARDQRIAAGASPDLTTIDRMARQMRDDRRTKAGADLQSSNRFADRVVVQQEPEGLGRLVSALITAIQQVNIVGAPVGQMLVPFNKIVSNLFEQSLDYTPVGIVRGALGGHLTDVVQFNKDGIKFREGSKMFDSTERWERAITGALATSIGFALYALAASMKDEDDEDVPFMIYAFGPTDKNKRSQMPKGWAPFTIKIGDVYYKFAEAPFGMMFAGIGSALDAIRYEKMDDKTAVDKLTYVMKSAAKGFMTQGVLSSVDTAIDVLMLKASDKKLSDIPVSAMKGAIPGQGFLRDLSTLTDDRKIDGSTMKAALLRDIPFVKSYAGKPELNAFGEPVTFDGLPVVRRFVNGVEKNHVADYLGRNDLYIPGMPPTIEVGSYLPKEMKDRLQRRALEVSAMENGMFTPEQNYEFKKRAGQLTKIAVERIMSASPPITNDVQRKKVQSVLNKQIEIARKRAMLEAVPIK